MRKLLAVPAAGLAIVSTLWAARPSGAARADSAGSVPVPATGSSGAANPGAGPATAASTAAGGVTANGVTANGVTANGITANGVAAGQPAVAAAPATPAISGLGEARAGYVPIALPPSPFDADAALPAHADRVVDYTLRARLDPTTHVIHGEGTLKWRNTSRVPTSEIWLHLYLNAFKNERSVFARENVGRFRGEVAKEWGALDVHKLVFQEAPGGSADLWRLAELRRPGDEDETDVRVPLPRAVAPGETVTFTMEWDARLPNVIMRTGHDGTFHMVAQWFPKIARLEADGRWAHFPFHRLAEFYADYGSYDVTVDVPASFVVGATGPAVESRVEGGRRIERHVQGDVHDFAWTAWDKYQTLNETIDGVDVRVLYPPGYRIVAMRELATLRFALPHFGARYGRYPYPTLTVVHPPESAREAGGMEYPTLITTGGAWWGPPGVMLHELVTVHEFGHQYFYGLLGSDEMTWPFLDEGLNSFAEQESLGRWLGTGSAVHLVGLDVSDSAVHGIGGRTAALNEPVAQPAYTFATGADYGALVYSRTASLLETLRRVHGDDAVLRTIGRYARKFRYQHPVPDDLLAVVEENLGPKARELLRLGLFERGWVDFAVLSVEAERARQPRGIFDREGGRVTLTDGRPTGPFVGSVLVARRGTLKVPVEIDLVLADGTTRRVLWDGEQDTFRIPYEGPVALRGAIVDPDEAILLDQNRTNNFDKAPGTSSGTPRLFERSLYWAQLLVQTLSP